MKNLICETWEFIEQYEIATTEELRLVTNIIGYNIKALNGIIYVRTGYDSLNHIKECEPETYG